MLALCGDIEIGYDDVGTGEVVLFIHGFPHNRAFWSAQLGALLGRARCIAPDLRGFGETSSGGPYSIDRYADDLVLLLDTLRIERAVVCGLSMGGYVALAFWRRHRRTRAGLILMDTRAGGDSADGKRAARRDDRPGARARERRDRRRDDRRHGGSAHAREVSRRSSTRCIACWRAHRSTG